LPVEDQDGTQGKDKNLAAAELAVIDQLILLTQFQEAVVQSKLKKL
jgi:hypothetical protein